MFQNMVQQSNTRHFSWTVHFRDIVLLLYLNIFYIYLVFQFNVIITTYKLNLICCNVDLCCQDIRINKIKCYIYTASSSFTGMQRAMVVFRAIIDFYVQVFVRIFAIFRRGVPSFGSDVQVRRDYIIIILYICIRKSWVKAAHVWF